MQALRLAAPALAFATVLSSVLLALGFASAARITNDAPRPTPNDHRPVALTSSSEVPEGKVLSASDPTEDVAGEPVPGLPRYPGSVRVAYSEDRADGLMVVRAGYLADKPPNLVRDFCAGVLRSEGWRTANVEYSGGEWYFLAVRGGREAVVEVSARGGGSLVEVEVSRPLDQGSASAGGSKR